MAPLSEEQGERLRHHVDRILALKAKIDGKDAEVRAIYAEVKAAGFDKTSVGKVVGYLRLPRDRQQDIDAGQHMAVSMPLREWPADLASSPSLRSLLLQEQK